MQQNGGLSCPVTIHIFWHICKISRCEANVDNSRVRAMMDDKEYYLWKVLTGDKDKSSI